MRYQRSDEERTRPSMRIFAGALGRVVGFGGAQLVFPAQTMISEQPGPALQLARPSVSDEVQYRDCSAARVAGAAPVKRGDRVMDRTLIVTTMASAANRFLCSSLQFQCELPLEISCAGGGGIQRDRKLLS